MITGDPYDIGYDHEYLLWCPACNNIEEEETLNPLCQRCGEELVDIDKKMFPIIYELQNINWIHTVACCEGHVIKYSEESCSWYTPYLSFTVDKDIKYSDIFNGKFPMLSRVTMEPDYTCIDCEDEKLFFYRILKNKSQNFQFTMKIIITMDEFLLSTEKEEDDLATPDVYFNHRKKIFLDQLYNWAKSLKNNRV